MWSVVKFRPAGLNYGPTKDVALWIIYVYKNVEPNGINFKVAVD